MIPESALNNFAKQILKQYPKINCGGCAVFAAHMGRHLQRYYPVRIITYGNQTHNTVNSVRKRVKVNTCPEWGAHGLDLNHLAIEFTDHNGKVWEYDTMGLYPVDSVMTRFPKHCGYLTVEEAMEMASIPDGWNDDFDRSHIPELKQQIRKFFFPYPQPKTPIKESVLVKGKRNIKTTIKKVKTLFMKK